MTVGDTDVTEWDFFVSYTQADRTWAEWIAWQLEAAGHSVLFQGWDFVPGTNWIQLMQHGVTHAARLIAVLSPDYLDTSVFGASEWQAVWDGDPTGAQRRVIPIRVAECPRPGLLTGIVGIDLFDVPEPKATQRLQDAIARALAGRAKPLTAPAFPGQPAATGPGGPRTATAPPSSYTAPPTHRPQFPGRTYHVNLRGASGVQVGDHNTQTNAFGTPPEMP
jgi:hypothetical protein